MLILSGGFLRGSQEYGGPDSSIPILVWQEAGHKGSQSGNRKIGKSGLQVVSRATTKRTGLAYGPAEIYGVWDCILAKPPSPERWWSLGCGIHTPFSISSCGFL